MKTSTDPKKIEELLTRGVDTVYPTREAFEKMLKSGKRIRVYHGIDPTSPVLHIGHTVSLRKLRQLQELGHEVVLLIGSFTAMIGDPTGKDATRKPLTREEVLANAQSYKMQASKILDFDGKNPVRIRFNHEWLDPMTLRDFVTVSHEITVPQLLERDMFERRRKEGGTVTLPELLYPLLQGYDSVALDVDLEIGGTDQTFNMLVGRDLMRSLKKKEKIVLTTPLLADANGKKIGKSEGNAIGIADPPDELYGKIMALGDDVIVPVFELCTDVTMDEIKKMKEAMKKGGNPRDFKALLAHTIVAMYHSKKDADAAAVHFDKLFRDHAAPDEMPEVRVKKEKGNIVDILLETKLVSSKTEARRLIEQGGIKIDGVVVRDMNAEVTISKKGVVLQKGKRHFVRIVRG